MLSALQRLAIEQDFSDLGIETNARSKLDQAANAFNKKELTTSANLFLESWRILQNEYESNLYTQVNSLPELEQQRQTKSQQNKGRMILSFAALNDLARACSQNDEEYKDEAGKCKLQVYALQHGWVRNTIAKALDIDENSKSSVLLEGKGVAQVFLLKDPLGRLLEKADSFKEAAAIVSKFCFFHVACVSGTSKEHDVAYEFISNSMRWVCIRASLEAVCIKDAKFKSSRITQMQAESKSRPETEKYEGIKKELVIRTDEQEQDGNPLEKEKEVELIEFLEKFHTTDYNGKSCQQMQQKDKSGSSNEDESTDQESVYEDSLQDEDKDLDNLFDRFHITDPDRK
ncbi:hypothetical protein VC83_03561 [Pseudogymnoascus destructans]|uniref:Uncharacterized protein n=2 Tax=Pseudogymnoascus destructans TaxID=655981 RepID=L8G6W5_PSED2|nr:uncharacterized protein VC83_03561 [Pseudogymnoascus destructans]ELR08413.1 hypothetical protein GMDG_03202 [Pseudogymnoascus destructans 20631-21]OAF60357.1 hypothetical protein VC83_03561 [Pseudogymnoascus destructans]